jgi:hypothetical protein
VSRRRYRITFYVTEGPDEDGEFAHPDSVAMAIESNLRYAWRETGNVGPNAMRLDSEVTSKREPRWHETKESES